MISSKLHKLSHWEFWPSALFYVPNLPYAIFLAIKAKHPAFFSVVNPAIKSSGNGSESKFATLALIPNNFKPKSVLHKVNSNFSNTLAKLKTEKINFPLIVKPDVGFRGLLVKKITSENELILYLKKYTVDVIIQEYISLENECGIFYYRNPNLNEGKISSITIKKYAVIIGDGKSSLKQLICKNSRTNLYKDEFFKLHLNNLNSIPKKGEKIELSTIGNHCKGTEFLDGNHLISKKLEATFDKISSLIPGWFYGRIDLKYNTFDELEKGENFKIIEINGIISEPTHMYDVSQSSYFKALKAIRNHWKYLYEIAKVNHQEKSIPYKDTKLFIAELIELRAYYNRVKSLNTF